MSNMKMVSLYTGAGGLDYGFEMAGFSNVGSVEMDHYCCETLRKNRDWNILEKNIHDVPSSMLMDVAGVRKYETDILIGGPPCQPFSKSGYWANGDSKRLDDPRAKTLDAFMRCVNDLLPEVLFFENVHGISYSGKEEGFRFIQNELEKINKRNETNYVYSWSILDAVDYGVPQKRKRFFLVAHREGQVFQFPKPTHSNNQESDGQTILTQSP
jgi:DNA (cytosine-5)-methyltransferase 1